MRVHLNRRGLHVWLWRRNGFKIKRKRDFLFSDRYVNKTIPLGIGDWFFVLARDLPTFKP